MIVAPHRINSFDYQNVVGTSSRTIGSDKSTSTVEALQKFSKFGRITTRTKEADFEKLFSRNSASLQVMDICNLSNQALDLSRHSEGGRSIGSIYIPGITQKSRYLIDDSAGGTDESKKKDTKNHSIAGNRVAFRLHSLDDLLEKPSGSDRHVHKRTGDDSSSAMSKIEIMRKKQQKEESRRLSKSHAANSTRLVERSLKLDEEAKCLDDLKRKMKRMNRNQKKLLREQKKTLRALKNKTY